MSTCDDLEKCQQSSHLARSERLHIKRQLKKQYLISQGMMFKTRLTVKACRDAICRWFQLDRTAAVIMDSSRPPHPIVRWDKTVLCKGESFWLNHCQNFTFNKSLSVWCHLMTSSKLTPINKEMELHRAIMCIRQAWSRSLLRVLVVRAMYREYFCEYIVL